MTKQNEEKMPISATLDSLSVGAMTYFPLNRLSSVKNICSTKLLTCGRRYATHINREQSILEVTRVL